MYTEDERIIRNWHIFCVCSLCWEVVVAATNIPFMVSKVIAVWRPRQVWLVQINVSFAGGMYARIGLGCLERELSDSSQTPGKRFRQGARDGAEVRALASHQCGPGSNSGVDAIRWLSLLFVLSFAPRGFSPGTPVFPLLKTHISKFQSDQESGRRRTTLWMCYLQIVIYLFFILFRRLSYDWNELPPWIVSLSVAWRDKNSCVGDLALDFCYYYYYYFAIMGNFIVRSPTVLQTSHQPCWNRVEMEDGWSRYNCYWRHGQSS